MSGPTNWLDRLRSSKGLLSAAEDLDIDPFLGGNASDSLTTNSPSEPSQSNVGRVTSTDVSRRNGETTVADILSDLFNMGIPGEGVLRVSGKKRISRKQTNPKFCFISTAFTSNEMAENCSDICVRNDENVQAKPASLHNSDNQSNNCGENDDAEEAEDEQTEKDGGEDRELKGYSRSEVTVIDTSCEVWKFDKLVFRRKNVWKVRDKKGKSWAARMKKKRKGAEFEFRNGNDATKKKAKLYSDLEEHPSACAVRTALKIDETREEVCMGTPDALPKNRCHISSSPRKLEKSGSSAVLIKAIPTSKKSGRILHKNHLKGNYRQNKHLG